MKKYQNYIVLTVAFCLLTLPATAQRFDGYRLEKRITELEKELVYLRQQGASVQSIPENPGAVTVKITRLEEAMRDLRGDVEETQHKIQQMEERLKRFQEDVEFRLKDVEAAGQGAVVNMAGNAQQQVPLIQPLNPGVAPVAPAATGEKLQNQSFDEPYRASDEGAPQPLMNGQASSSTAPSVLQMPDPDKETPRNLYNQAFRMLNQTNYEAAEKFFKRFTERFSSDPLIGNAWYWLGETYYVRRQYIKAADSFRQGFELLPEGPKAGDNLLKLAMSLSAMQKSEEACIVLRQVEERYANDSDSLRSKAQRELNRMGCAAE